MDLRQTFAHRLFAARTIKGLSFRELSDAMGGIVSAQTIANYEKGASFPDSDIMSILLRALDITLDDIMRPARTKPENVEFTYRKQKSVGKKTNEAIKFIAMDKAEKYLEIEDVLQIKNVETPDYDQFTVTTEEDAEMVAQTFRNDLGLGRNPIPNVFILLDRLGIKVLPVSTDEKFDAANFIYDNRHFIIMNTRIDMNERQRFTLMHDLGHILLNIPDEVNEKIVERLCNRFAGNVLLPPDVLRETLGHHRIGIAPQELAYLQSKYGISIKAIMASAKDLGIITEGNYAGFYKKMNAVPKFRDYVDKSRFNQEEMDSEFESMVYRALTSELITASKAAYLLGESIESISDHVSMM